MHSGTYASTSLPGHGNIASTTECAAPSHGIQQRPIPQTIYPYPTCQTPASSVQPAYNPPTQQAVPTRSNPTAAGSNPCLSSTPSPFVAPAVHRPAGQFHPIPPTRQQSLLRTQMLSGPVPDGKLPDTLNSELYYSNTNIVKQHHHQHHHHQPSTMPEDLVYNKSETNNGTDPRKSSVSAKAVTTEQYAINCNQSLKSPNGPRKSNSTQAEQRQRARELYAALKHRHPVTTDFGVGKASNSSDEQETKWLRKSLSRRCTTNGSTGLSSATAIPTRDEPTQTNGFSHTDLSSSSVPVSSTASVVSNSLTSWPTVGSITSEQLAKMLQTGDPQVRSYLQAYVRRPGTNGPPQPPPPPPTVPPPPPPLSSAPYSANSTLTDQATFIQARAEPEKSVANLPCAVPVDDAGWGGLSLDARRRRRPALGEEAKSPTLDPLAASLSSSVSAASNFPIRNTESTASSLPRHVRLSMFSSSLGPEPAPPNTVIDAQRRPSASIQSDVEPPVSPDLSVYAKRMQERMKEGLRAAQESLWVSSQSRTGSLIAVPKTSKTDLIYDRINNMASTNSTTLPALTEPSSVLSQAIVDDLERGQLDLWDRGRRPTHDRFPFDAPGLSTLVGSGSVQTDTVPASRAQSRLHAPIRYPTLPSWTPSYTNGPTKSNAFSELGKTNPRPVSATGHNSRRDCEERLFGEAKNGTCSDVEDLLDQAKRKMFPLLDEQVSNRKDIKLAFNSSSDTEDIFTTVNRLHRSAGMHFGYTLPGPKASCSGPSNGADGQSPERGGNDLDRIYGIVPWSPGGLRHSRPFQPSFLSAQRSPDPGPPPDGSASAPPGTPIKLPYAAPSTLFNAAMVHPEFAHLFGKSKCVIFCVQLDIFQNSMT
ncbi:hypothetical protein FGIG_03369 [Fasciola gigantica]|uniref:Uncharacterized protein n=1 Tax=Fasciola gigantica TaxID=46835 RepID=A0A504YLL5_FASGI|nr:hypothetical protein FGIG_03369 [Fasciola gigantica]